ncbi:hypothetical protein CC80DRAFT_545681 [Byssothecium circinans]|uniref:Uncharacterized protein n=1 Tax=Byssothecium circinans TaxID=147558 RepID=A0A6A5U4Q6_9PLEO|nr:hypothetical protein CC80DRAFT_545681 [Byssothecium circinans]
MAIPNSSLAFRNGFESMAICKAITEFSQRLPSRHNCPRFDRSSGIAHKPATPHKKEAAQIDTPQSRFRHLAAATTKSEWAAPSFHSRPRYQKLPSPSTQMYYVERTLASIQDPGSGTPYLPHLAKACLSLYVHSQPYGTSSEFCLICIYDITHAERPPAYITPPRGSFSYLVSDSAVPILLFFLSILLWDRTVVPGNVSGEQKRS